MKVTDMLDGPQIEAKVRLLDRVNETDSLCEQRCMMTEHPCPSLDQCKLTAPRDRPDPHLPKPPPKEPA